MRTRGYIDDRCLTSFVHCKGESGRYRPEATAQALVIKRLGLTRTEWEVGPEDSYWNDPPDPPDPRSYERWRIDVVVDKSTIIEVRRWSFRDGGNAVISDVQNTRMNRYIREAELAGVIFRPNSELRAPVPWIQVYPVVGDGAVAWYCVWADRVNDGHVYFAPAGAAPAWVGEQQPGCRDPHEDPVWEPVLQPPPDRPKIEVKAEAPDEQRHHIRAAHSVRACGRGVANSSANASTNWSTKATNTITCM